MSLGNAIGLLSGVVISIIGLSVLFKDVRIQDYPKKWKEDIDSRYIPEILRKYEPPKGKEEVQADEVDQHVV